MGKQGLKVAFQMDPMHSINIKGDSGDGDGVGSGGKGGKDLEKTACQKCIASLCKFLGAGGEKDKGNEDESGSDSEEEPPKYIPVFDIASNTEFYKRDFTVKEIKKIYKRIINPTDPQFVDIITCNPVERISKMRVNCLYKFILKTKASF